MNSITGMFDDITDDYVEKISDILDDVIAWQGANNKILGNKIDEIIDYLNSKGE